MELSKNLFHAIGKALYKIQTFEFVVVHFVATVISRDGKSNKNEIIKNLSKLKSDTLVSVTK